MGDDIVLTVSERPIDGRFRILDRTGQIATRTDNGNPVDYGGQTDREKLVRMAGHIKESMEKRRGRDAS